MRKPRGFTGKILSCPVCYKQFEQTYGTRTTRIKYCSDACKQRAYRERKAAQAWAASWSNIKPGK